MSYTSLRKAKRIQKAISHLVLMLGAACVVGVAALFLGFSWSDLFPAYAAAHANDDGDPIPTCCAYALSSFLICHPIYSTATVLTANHFRQRRWRSAGQRGIVSGVGLLIFVSLAEPHVMTDYPGVPAWQCYFAEAGFYQVWALALLLVGLWCFRRDSRMQTRTTVETLTVDGSVWPPAPMRKESEDDKA